jgi:hypothetical protein
VFALASQHIPDVYVATITLATSPYRSVSPAIGGKWVPVSQRHSGPEAWYTLTGETRLETPEGAMVDSAGGQNVVVVPAVGRRSLRRTSATNTSSAGLSVKWREVPREGIAILRVCRPPRPYWICWKPPRQTLLPSDYRLFLLARALTDPLGLVTNEGCVGGRDPPPAPPSIFGPNETPLLLGIPTGIP